MRLLLLLVATLSGSAVFAAGVALDTARRFEFTDCAAGGSAAQTIPEGTYLFRVTTEDVHVCFAATCASGGEKFPAGTVMLLSISRAGSSVSCRSALATGDAIFTATR